jgi:hypothetical protein
MALLKAIALLGAPSQRFLTQHTFPVPVSVLGLSATHHAAALCMGMVLPSISTIQSLTKYRRRKLLAFPLTC